MQYASRLVSGLLVAGSLLIAGCGESEPKEPVSAAFYRHLWAKTDCIFVNLTELDGILWITSPAIRIDGAQLEELRKEAINFSVKQPLSPQGQLLSYRQEIKIRYYNQLRPMGELNAVDGVFSFNDDECEFSYPNNSRFCSLLLRAVDDWRKANPEKVNVGNSRSGEREAWPLK